LPPEILNRKKRGFEIPIQEWLGGEINRLLNSELFRKDYIENQGVFKYEGVHALIKSTNKKDFGDNIYLLWALIVFQYWWNKYLMK
jgi:asparagine synthase (glutamine-hydrolysing)